MTIYDVAERLSSCANSNCNKCKYEPKANCIEMFLAEMAEECRKIAEEEDDRK